MRVVGLALLGWSGMSMPALASSTHGHGGLTLANGEQDRGSARVFARARLANTQPSQHVSSGAMQRLRADVGQTWGLWDEDTGVPSRMVFSGVPIVGGSTDPAIAATFATDFILRHLDVFGPGTTTGDWVLIRNDTHAGIRSVVFQQFHNDLKVLGGQISVRIKADHLVAVASSAFPSPSGAHPKTSLMLTNALGRGQQWLEHDLGGESRMSSEVEGPLILPIVTEGHIDYQTVYLSKAHQSHPSGVWAVYLDASSGEPLARRPLSFNADAEVRFNVPIQYLNDERTDAPARELLVTIDDRETTTDVEGRVQFDAAAEGPSTLTLQAVGRDVVVTSETTDLATFTVDVQDGETVVLNASDDPAVDAQLIGYVHARIAKDYVRDIDPSAAWLDEELNVLVNVDDQCNAQAVAPSTILFFRESEICENTGRIPDIIYHEFGHIVHQHQITAGATFDGAVSEGIADYLGSTMTNDPIIGQGFFIDQADAYLRDLNPPGYEWTWPDDRGEIHYEGQIIGGALWDLRTALIEKYGEAEGIATADKLWYGILPGTSNIPSAYLEALIADDDDGDIINGTPNVCEINAAFGKHGLLAIDGNATIDFTLDASEVTFDVTYELPDFPGCPVTTNATLWARQQGSSTLERVPMTNVDGRLVATVPRHDPGTTLEYSVDFTYYSDSNATIGTTYTLPYNPADEWYQTFTEPTVKLHCLNQETLSNWMLNGGFDVNPSLGQFDPSGAYEGEEDLGLFVGQSGQYSADATAILTSPLIDVSGYRNVHLQFRRWLTVEDGFYDHARIVANDETIWANYQAPNEDLARTHHLDREWQFQSVDLSESITDGDVQLSFLLESDAGLQFGGWNLDEVCVVAVPEPEDGGCSTHPRRSPSGLWLLPILWAAGRRRRRQHDESK